ncbi:LysR family transcriptional regulator [Flaviflexus ciconiae]|nr:LysR family transcriptional regulator [Flaviflexus ciconiae]
MAAIDRIDWLETFIAVSDFQSFSRAAHSLHCSQSRVSVHIAELEKAVRHKLVNRSCNPIELTEAGIVFLDHARRAIKNLNEAIDEMDQLNLEVRGHFTIGTVPSISAMFLPQVLRALKDKYPRIRVDITERTTDVLLDNLLDGVVDLAIRVDSATTSTESSSIEPLWGEPILAVFPKDHPLAATKGSIHPDELNQFEVGTTGAPGIGIDRDMRSRFDMWGVSGPRSNYFTEQPQTLFNMAKAGILIPIINLLAYESCDHRGLTYRVINDELAARRVFLQWNPARPFNAAMQAFIDIVYETQLPDGTVPITHSDL